MSIFKSMAVNPVTASEIMEALDVDLDTLSSPKIMKKLEEVIKFLSPYEDRLSIIRKLTTGKPGINKLDHLLEYSRIRRDHAKKKDQLDATDEMEQTDEVKALRLIKQEQVASLEEQLAIFE